MQAESLQSLDADDTSTAKPVMSAVDQYSPQFLEEAAQFLRLQVHNFVYVLLPFDRPVFRHMIALFWSCHTYGKHIFTAFGAVSNTKTKRKWRVSAPAQMRTSTSDVPKPEAFRHQDPSIKHYDINFQE